MTDIIIIIILMACNLFIPDDAGTTHPVIIFLVDQEKKKERLDLILYLNHWKEKRKNSSPDFSCIWDFVIDKSYQLRVHI